MNNSFEYITTLEYRLKAALNEIAAFKSGKKYIQMEQHLWGIIRNLESQIKSLKTELAKAHSVTRIYLSELLFGGNIDKKKRY